MTTHASGFARPPTARPGVLLSLWFVADAFNWAVCAAGVTPVAVERRANLDRGWRWLESVLFMRACLPEFGVRYARKCSPS